MIIGSYMMATIQFKNKGGRMGGTEQVDPYQKANALLSDCIINYRTVISFGQNNVDKINENYDKLVTGPMEDKNRLHNKTGFYFGVGGGGRTLYCALLFSVCFEFLIVKSDLKGPEYVEYLNTVFFAAFLLFYSVMGVGFQAANIPSVTKAQQSAIPVFAIIDEPSTLDVRKCKQRPLKKVENGLIEFKNITFHYPTRGFYVLRNFNMVIPAGQKIALVGSSGCGKSTITNLLLQFYNIEKGELLVDGKNIDQYDVIAMRRQIGYVMQEPVLFNKTIKENILFGKQDATDEEVYVAA